MKYLGSIRLAMVLATAAALSLPLSAQTTIVPETQNNGTVSFDSQHLKDVPYNAMLPKPIFPSTPRVQKEFTVRYIYDYAMSTYTPAVTLPRVPRAQYDRSTPEGALIAMLSAIQTGDGDGWLSCWDDEAQKFWNDKIKTQKTDAMTWMHAFQQTYAGKSMVLYYRLETTGYVILDFRVVDPAKPNEGTPIPTVWKNLGGKWLATNDLMTSILLGSQRPGVAGLDNRVSPEPLKNFFGGGLQEAEAQQEFVKSHAVVPGITRGAK